MSEPEDLSSIFSHLGLWALGDKSPTRHFSDWLGVAALPNMVQSLATFPKMWLAYFVWLLDRTSDVQKQPGCISVFDGRPRDEMSRISDQLRLHGIPSYSMDVMNPCPLSKVQDVSCTIGIQQFLIMLARMAKNGLVWMAPPCGSFTQFMSRSVHQRSRVNPYGRFSDFVCQGNDMAEFCARAMMACAALGLSSFSKNIPVPSPWQEV